MRLLALAGLLSLAACGRDSPGVDGDLVNTQMLERVAEQRNETVDIGASARLGPLGAVAPPAGYTGPVCSFTRDGRLLLVAFGDRAIARIAGAQRTFRAGGPVSAASGFWRDRELAISIGVTPGAPARARVTNRLTEAQEDHPGQWQCRG